MIDTGGGTFLRFGEAGAKFASLDFIGLSHFHTDHSADLPALLKSGFFSDRQRSLIVAGPDSSAPFPGLNTYLESMLKKPDGAYAYLSGYLDGTGGLAKIEPYEVAKDNSAAVTVFGEEDGAMQISALHVPHGIVPALAFRVRIGDASIVFASDQNGDDPAFIEFAKNATILVMHMPVPEGVSGAGRKLHAPPSVIGNIAQQADVGTLVLSHFMARSLKNLDNNVKIVKANYDGRVIVANDLDCITLKK
jgi:ribonuclease BN (tRNA processing enzyme)